MGLDPTTGASGGDRLADAANVRRRARRRLEGGGCAWISRGASTSSIWVERGGGEGCLSRFDERSLPGGIWSVVEVGEIRPQFLGDDLLAGRPWRLVVDLRAPAEPGDHVCGDVQRAFAGQQRAPDHRI
jgi:hypothetical protein